MIAKVLFSREVARLTVNLLGQTFLSFVPDVLGGTSVTRGDAKLRRLSLSQFGL